MPDRPYIARRVPPDTLDRISFHWAEIWIAFFSVVSGALRLADNHTSSIQLTTGIVPPLPSNVISGVLVAGGAVWFYSIVRRFKTVNGYYLSLRTGLAFLALGWASFTVAAIMLKPSIVSIWVQSLTLTAIASGLYIQSFHNEKANRRRKEI